MGLRCVIGHDYGKPQTSRDRRQRGNEVVVTVREYRECSRCGHRRILSENKEVTADPRTEAADEARPEKAWLAPEGIEASASATAEAEFSRGPADEPVSAAEDDGVILEDEPETPPRGYGEWPATDRGGVDPGGDEAPEPWPDEAPGPTAEESVAAGPDASPGPGGRGEAAEPAPPAEGPARSPAAGAGRTSSPRPDPSDTELVCPECGETWSSINASLRPGDICPECRLGYLDEQVIQ